MSKLHRNAIITGSFDSYCLLCEVHLKENVEDHISASEHIEMLQHSSYVPKYKFHHIWKVKKGYYCEFCNILLPTLVQTGLHVTSTDHGSNVGKRFLKEIDEGIIAYDQILIDKEAWNGLVEETICCLCNEEFNDKSVHLKQSSHILQLIQKGVHIKENGIVYRNMDSTTLHCMVCNIIFEIKNGNLHFDSKQHLEQFRKSCDKKNKLDENSKKSSIDERVKQDAKYDSKQEEEHSACVKNKEKDVKNYSYDHSKRNVTVKIQEDKKINEAKTELEQSIKEKELCLPFQAKEKARILAKKNKITYKFGKQSAYCSVCDVTISSTLKRLEEHIDENNHKKNFEKSQVPGNCIKTNNNIIKLPNHKFINVFQIYKCKTWSKHLQLLVLLNRELCMNIMSYEMMTVNYSVIRCQACRVTVDSDNQKEHCKSFTHVNALKHAPVVISLQSEYVREIHPGLYHCGFCNLIAGDWEDLTMHLESVSHEMEKIQCFAFCNALKNC